MNDVHVRWLDYGTDMELHYSQILEKIEGKNTPKIETIIACSYKANFHK